jgi:hypothetical protein
MTTADFSDKGLGSSGAIIVGAWITHKDNGAISSVNLLKNAIPVKQAQELVKIMQAKEKLTTLCRLSRDETELDFSGQNLGAGDAVLITNDISDMGTLFKLVMRQNDISGAEAGKVFANMLAQNTVLKELDLSSQKVEFYGCALDAAFAKEFAVGISNNRTLTSLDISRNDLANGLDDHRNYSEDLSGRMHELTCLAPRLIVRTLLLQVLLPSLMPSAAIGHYPLLSLVVHQMMMKIAEATQRRMVPTNVNLRCWRLE